MNRLLLVYVVILLVAFLNVSNALDTSDSPKELVLVQILTRHGERTALYNPPNDTTVWNYPNGQLTPHGMMQHFDLGRAMRKKYIDDLHFINSTWLVQQVRVRSSDVDRTLQSAESFFRGMFPDGTGPLLNSTTPAIPDRQQPLPIHTVQASQDEVFRAQDLCNSFSSWKESLFSSQTVKDIEKNYSVFIEKMQKVSGWGDALTYKTWGILYDPVVCETTNYGKTLGLPLSDEDVSTIYNLRYKWWDLVFPNGNRQVHRWIGSGFLAELKKNIDTTLSHESALKLYMYSGHDSTVAAVMCSFESFEGPPPYATHVVWELYNDTSSHEQFVRILYNDKVVLLPQCDKEYCPLELFYKILSAIIPENWDDECHMLPPSSEKHCRRVSSWYWVGLGLMTSAFIFTAFCTIYFGLTHMARMQEARHAKKAARIAHLQEHPRSPRNRTGIDYESLEEAGFRVGGGSVAGSGVIEPIDNDNHHDLGIATRFHA